METLEFIKTAKDGKIIIELPENFEGKEVKVKVMEYEISDHPEDWAKLPGAERVKILEQFKGKDKFPNAKVDKYDVYDQ